MSNTVQLPLWAAVLFGLITALGGLTGVAALIKSLSNASKSRVDGLCEIIDTQSATITAQGKQIARQRGEINDLKTELRTVKEQYRQAQRENATLRSRIKLLAKIITHIVEVRDTASTVEDLINGWKITGEERRFLVSVVEEADRDLIDKDNTPS